MKVANISPGLVIIHPYSVQSIGHKYYPASADNLNNAASAVWPTANKAIFVPFCLKRRLIVSHLYTSNGATVSNSQDVGIYDYAGNKIVNVGGQLQSGTSALQIADISNTEIGPGLYFMGMSQNSVTGTYLSNNSGLYAGILGCCGVMEQVTAYPLPATATFQRLTSDYLPTFGIIGKPLVV